MLNLDPGKLLVIAIVAIIVLGPERLPKAARQAGSLWRSFNEFRHRMETDVRKSLPNLPTSTEIVRLTRSPSALLDHLSNMSPLVEGTDLGQATAGNGQVEAGAICEMPVPPSRDSRPSRTGSQTEVLRSEVVGVGDPGQN